MSIYSVTITTHLGTKHRNYKKHGCCSESDCSLQSSLSYIKDLWVVVEEDILGWVERETHWPYYFFLLEGGLCSYLSFGFLSFRAHRHILASSGWKLQSKGPLLKMLRSLFRSFTRGFVTHDALVYYSSYVWYEKRERPWTLLRALTIEFHFKCNPVLHICIFHWIPVFSPFLHLGCLRS